MGGHFESEYTILLRSSRRVGKKTIKTTHANLSKLPLELIDQNEVLVKGGESFVIRDRETFDDLVRGERIPAFLEAEA